MGPLLRSRADRKIAGVCGGLARAYDWDPTLVRIAVLALAVFTGIGLVGYVICWLVIPEDPAGMPSPLAAYGGVTGQYPPPPYTAAPPTYPPAPPTYTSTPPPPYPPSDNPPAA